MEIAGQREKYRVLRENVLLVVRDYNKVSRPTPANATRLTIRASFPLLSKNQYNPVEMVRDDNRGLKQGRRKVGTETPTKILTICPQKRMLSQVHQQRTDLPV